MQDDGLKVTQDKTGVSFFDNINASLILTKEQIEKSKEVINSRELRILLWSRVLNIARSNSKTTEEAAANFYEIRGLFSILNP